METAFFSRLDEDDSQSGHDRLLAAVERRQFENPNEDYRTAMFSVMKVMPKAARDYIYQE